MKQFYNVRLYAVVSILFFAFFLSGISAFSQACPASATTTINNNPDTYYPGLDNVLNSGTKSITLGAAGYGTSAINSGEILLIIQMQGAQINASNNNSYGAGISGGTGNGYLNNSQLYAGNLEYVVATNTVPLSGGTLQIGSGLINNYRNADFATDGQYRFQVIRLGLYYNLILGGTITAPNWNGKTGGVVVLTVTNNLNFNGQTINASGAGFRGGGARQLNGGSGGANTDYVTLSSKNFHASKGEGIAGMPRFINNNGSLSDNGVSMEGYPNGSYASGAPGNAGGGGSDGNPSSNDQNSGGGGGANGGDGGKGGNSWSSNLPSGGKPGARFLQSNSSRFVMGGGGGAGTTNNGTGIAVSGFSSSGAAGGGIVILTAASITGTGTINVSGASGNLTVLNDGSGGGGAGGTVLLYAGSGHSNITVNANGGTGGTNTGIGSPHGPGGGGGGGIVYSNGLLNAATSITGGNPGVTAANNNYGALAGASGMLVQNITQSQVPLQTLYCSLLPVNFLSLAAVNSIDNSVLVKWEVSNESNVSAYKIEKSTDGNNFYSTGTVAYKQTSGNMNSYSFTDAENKKDYAVLYYRVRQVALNGSTILSKVIVVKMEKKPVNQLSVFPNPVKTTATISFYAAAGTDVSLRLLDFAGNAIWRKEYRTTMGTNSVQLDNTEKIPNGTYMLQCYNGSTFEVLKVLIAH